MARTLIRLLFLSLLINAGGNSVALNSADIAGDWILTEQFKDETRIHRVTLEVAGNKITGQSGPLKITGEIDGSTITFKRLNNDGTTQTSYTGKVEVDKLTGDGVF